MHILENMLIRLSKIFLHLKPEDSLMYKNRRLKVPNNWDILVNKHPSSPSHFYIHQAIFEHHLRILFFVLLFESNKDNSIEAFNKASSVHFCS